MTLGCDIAAVLMRALDMLHHQTSPAQHALLTTAERKATLHQLAVTVGTAAKLAEVAHVDAVTAQRALAGGPSRRDSAAIMDEIAAEIERFKVGSARIRRGEAEMVKTGTGEEGEEAGKVGEHVEGVVEETAGEEGEGVGKVGEQVEGVVEETAGEEGEEAGTPGEETAGVGTEEVIVVGEMVKAGAVVEAPGVVPRGRTLPETRRTGAVVPGRSGRSGGVVRRMGPLSQWLSDVEKAVEEMEREREERERD